MTKFKASFIHLFFSVIVVGLLFSIIFFIWYPKPFFDILNVIEPIELLVFVDVILGPLLTLIIYKKGKKHLKLDISIIVAFQLMALIYGTYIIYNGRPSLMVLNNDKFYALREKFANNNELKYPELKPNIFSSPKYALINNFQDIDIYSAYAKFEPLNNFDQAIMPFSLTPENMKSMFKSKVNEVEGLENKYKDADIVFYKLDFNSSLYYVVISKKHQSIIDYLKF